jgi:hypothetical protein
LQKSPSSEVSYQVITSIHCHFLFLGPNILPGTLISNALQNERSVQLSKSTGKAKVLQPYTENIAFIFNHLTNIAADKQTRQKSGSIGRKVLDAK